MQVPLANISLSLNIYSEVELLDHMVIPVLGFGGKSMQFSTIIVLIFYPTSSVPGLPCLRILINAHYLLLE